MEKHLVKKPVANVFERTYERRNAKLHPKVDCRAICRGKKRSESSKRQRRKEKTVALPACIVFRAPVIGEVRCLFGGIAQLGERLPCKQEASGSNPLISTNLGR